MTWVVVAVGLLLLVFLHELGHFTSRSQSATGRAASMSASARCSRASSATGSSTGSGSFPPAGTSASRACTARPPATSRRSWGRRFARTRVSLHWFSACVARSRPKTSPAARAAFPELQAAVEAAQLTPAARRSAHRALRDVEEGTSDDAYWRQRTWKRIAVIAAGPAMNILVAFIIFVIVYSTGAPSNLASTKVGSVERQHARGRGGPAGRRPAHRSRRPQGDDVRPAVEAHPLEPRPPDHRHRRSRRSDPDARSSRDEEGRRDGGSSASSRRRSSCRIRSCKSTRLAVDDCWHVVTGTVTAFGALFHAKERGQLTSTVGIVRMSQQALRVDFNYYLQIVGFVSMSLALLNLLPFLPLDGGHILFSRDRGRAPARARARGLRAGLGRRLCSDNPDLDHRPLERLGRQAPGLN